RVGAPARAEVDELVVEVAGRLAGDAREIAFARGTPLLAVARGAGAGPLGNRVRHLDRHGRDDGGDEERDEGDQRTPLTPDDRQLLHASPTSLRRGSKGVGFVWIHWTPSRTRAVGAPDDRHHHPADPAPV